MANFTCESITLDLRTTFRIAHGASDQRHNVLLHLGEGVGEAAAVYYYGDTQESIIEYLEGVDGQTGWDPFRLEELLNELPFGPSAAYAAVDIALHDLLGHQLGQPIYRLLGLNPDKTPQTSFTIGMDTPEVMAKRAAGSNMPIIKIKLGSPDDEAIVSAIRGATSSRLHVDVNAGWKREQAAALIPHLADYGLEFVEQPLAVGDIEGLRWLRDLELGIPIFADENIKTARDVAAHAGAVDGVVIKLMKSGGIREALRAIHTARALDMQVMIGCMVESSVGVTAAAHIASLCDYADLDGPLLIQNDPYRGISYDGARINLPQTPGLGVTRISP